MTKLKSIRLRARAVESATPGLFIHPCVGAPGRFTVTHGRSGLALGNFPDVAKARRYAKALGRIGDWTLTSKELKAEGGIIGTPIKRQKIRQLAVKMGGQHGGIYKEST